MSFNSNPSAPRDYGRRESTTCPVGGCPHPRWWHDVDEIPWPRIERCTIADCRCSGVVDLAVAA